MISRGFQTFQTITTTTTIITTTTTTTTRLVVPRSRRCLRRPRDGRRRIPREEPGGADRARLRPRDEP